MRNGIILIVEDEAAVRETNRNHLEKLGYSVYAADSIAEAKRLAAEYPPDLYLLDMLLPDGTGLDYCRELQMHTTAPVIILSCLSESENIISGIEQGGYAYLTKPYDLNVLSALVMAQLRRNDLMGTGRIKFSPLVVDLAKGIATLEGREIYLSQQEAHLLAFLASHPKRSFTSEQLFREIWGEGMDSDIVPKCICVLRKKLELNEASPIEIFATSDGRYGLNRTQIP